MVNKIRNVRAEGGGGATSFVVLNLLSTVLIKVNHALHLTLPRKQLKSLLWSPCKNLTKLRDLSDIISAFRLDI